MKFIANSTLNIAFYFLLFNSLLSGCLGTSIKPVNNLNRVLLRSSYSQREPSLGVRWIAMLVNQQGKDRIFLVDLRTQSIVPLPGLNRPDSQPISVSVSANGERLALVRQRDDQTELLVYRRKVGSLERLQISPKGIPRLVSLSANGKRLAVQVSREGRWDVDLIRL